MEDRRRAVIRGRVAALVAGAAALVCLGSRASAAPPAEAPRGGVPVEASTRGPSAGEVVDTEASIGAAIDRWALTEAEGRLKKAGRGVEAELLRARLDFARSRFDAVIARTAPLVASHPGRFEARALLGRAQLATGERREGLATLDAMADAYNADRVTTAEDLMWLGVGLHLTDYVKNANRVFKEALALDPSRDDARLAWAALFVSKYNFKDADGLYREVLARSPGHVEATVGLARIDVLSDRDLFGARAKLEEVLGGSPDCVPAHNLMALVELEHERPGDAAERLLAQSLRVAPNDPEALALLGAAYHLADDSTRFERTKKRALAANPRFAAFFATVAAHAARVHRYKEAVKLNEQALALDPEHWPALAGLGVGHSRLGDDARAIRFLNQAFDGDPYDVRTYNLLAHFYDDVRKHYVWLDVPPMRVRAHKEEEAILARHVPPLLREAHAALSKKYGFEPEPPLHVEIFPDPQTFSVRSTGLPQLSAHGICFGHVITSRSPSAGNFNWAEVLWHELSHVYHLALSNNRVPRWFTEGLALFESTEARPSWEREMDGELLAYLERGRLRGIAEFNLAFTQAKSMQDILVAYYHAFKVAQFIDATWGFAKMRRMLEVWGSRRGTPAVLREALGVSAAEFDARFASWLASDLARLTDQLRVDPGTYVDRVDAAWAEATAAPDDAAKQAVAAVAALARPDSAAAGRFAARALELDADEPRARYVQALLAHERGEHDAAAAALSAIVAAGHDGVAVQRLVARVAEARGDTPGLIAALQRATRIDPKDPGLLASLIGHLARAGRDAEAFEARRRLADLDQMNAGLIIALLDGAATHDASPGEVTRWIEQGRHIAPFSLELHLAVARAASRIGDDESTREAIASARLLAPQDPRVEALTP